MGKMKDKFIREQEQHVLDSLHDSKHWENEELNYEMYINSDCYFNDLESDADEQEFIKNLTNKNKLKRNKKCVE